jgi:UDP-glucose 4-epimerase
MQILVAAGAGYIGSHTSKLLAQAGHEPVVLDNLGNGHRRAGRGYSVREVITAIERIGGRRVPVREAPRRAGDPPILVADPTRANRELGWTARFSSLDHIVETACRWYAGRRPEFSETRATD